MQSYRAERVDESERSARLAQQSATDLSGATQLADSSADRRSDRTVRPRVEAVVSADPMTPTGPAETILQSSVSDAKLRISITKQKEDTTRVSSIFVRGIVYGATLASSTTEANWATSATRTTATVARGTSPASRAST